MKVNQRFPLKINIKKINIKVLFLLCISPLSTIYLNTHEQKSENHFEPLPFVMLKKSASGQSTQKLQTVADSPILIEAYFSPTCGHCAQFFNQLKEKDFIEKYIDTGRVHFWIRPFYFSSPDRLVVAFCLSDGGKKFLDLWFKFMEFQTEWIQFFTIDTSKEDEKIKKRQDILNKLAKKWKIKLLDDTLKELNLTGENPNASIILCALKIGFTVKEIQKITDKSNLQIIDRRLFATSQQALDQDNKPVQAVPVFFINKQFYGGMSLEKIIQKIDSLIKSSNSKIK